MKNWPQIVLVSALFVCLIGFISVANANRLPFENYKLAVQSFENKNLDQAKSYLDEVILKDFSSSNYLAKSIYLKSIILVSEINKDLKLNETFKQGREQIPISQEEKRQQFKMQAKDYQLQAERKVDTLIGLANYLVSNLPPLELNLDYPSQVGNYNPAKVTDIKQGTSPKQDNLEKLEEDLLSKQINRYLQLSLGLKGFGNVSVIRANKGDNLYKLAKQYNVPFHMILSANDQLTDPDELYPGEKIYIPQVDNAYLDYPAYFYYLSQLSYQVNPSRKEDIMRLVTKAYQLTNQQNESVDKKDTKQLTNKINLEEYDRTIEEQSSLIAKQQQELQELKKKYDQLLQRLKELKSEEDEENEEDSDPETTILEEDTADEYNVEQGPLDY
ncbi:LysM peptidoglycan-binding domain-containing protein [Halanaerobaculum tunisiense]